MKILVLVVMVMQLMGCDPVWAHRTEKEFDSDMEYMANQIRVLHPEVIWVDVENMEVVKL